MRVSVTGRPPLFDAEMASVVATLPPGATWYAAGVNTAPSSAAVTAAGEPVTT